MSTEVVLDPFEVAGAFGRQEFALNRGAIRVAPGGIDWGDAAIDSYKAARERGELPVDFRIPNREIRIPLTLGADGPAGFPLARAQLQSKIGLFQHEGGWVKRAAGVYADIVEATLTLPDAHGHLGVEADVVVVLEAIPDFYGDEEEDESEIGVSLDGRGLVFVVPGGRGDYPGRVRLPVFNFSSNPQRGLHWGYRCKHYDPADTAKLIYDADELEPLDAAVPSAFNGNSSIHNAALATAWTPMLELGLASSAGVEPLTHSGSYRLLVRCATNAPAAEAVQLRALYDVGDFTSPVENEAWAVPAADHEYVADLGEIRLDKVPGDVGVSGVHALRYPHRWFGQIQAKGTIGDENLHLITVWLKPIAEGSGLIRSSLALGSGYSALTASEDFGSHTYLAGLSGLTAPKGGNWAGAGDAGDFIVNTNAAPPITFSQASRQDITDSSIANGRYCFLPPVLDSCVVQAYFGRILDPTTPHAVDGFLGVLARYVDVNNWLFFGHQEVSTGLSLLMLAQRVGGTLSAVQFEPIEPPVGHWLGVRIQVEANGTYTCWAGAGGNPDVNLIAPAFLSDPVFVGASAALAPGGALDNGKVGIYDSNSSSYAQYRGLDGFSAWDPSDDAVIFAGRELELRTEGAFRQAADGGAYSPIIDEGDLPRWPTAGLEGRPVEVFLKSSRGDFDRLPDTGEDNLTCWPKRRASWLFPFDG